jgi:hypothetical protein
VFSVDPHALNKIDSKNVRTMTKETLVFIMLTKPLINY